MYVKGKKTLPLEKIKNVLLIQLGDIGDVVNSFPCARALKETLPKARIVFAVRSKAAGLIEGCPWVEDVIAVDTSNRSFLRNIFYQVKFWRKVRANNFDMAIDLRRDSRSAYLAFLSGAEIRVAPFSTEGKVLRNRLFTHLYDQEPTVGQYIVEHYMEPLAAYGIPTTELLPEISVSAEQEMAVSSLIKEEGIPTNIPLIVVQPFSLWSYKELSNEKYVQIIRRLTDQGLYSVCITGTAGERARAQQIAEKCEKNVFNLAGKTPLELVPAFYKKCRMFLGVDSAGIHIAAAVGTPVVSIYGPSNAVSWAPRGGSHRVVQKKMDCVPCGLKGCNGKEKSRCLDELTVDEVWAAIKDVLS
ncbi:MAG: glycosyltransferase family 9 protein [Desulfobulbaceae bacterium]|nr:glycosyltransferase family 9 protein [Desulfobulbaceae bacterium]HIJ77964.1 glycosyltransferase family 9 protein [Deltaproteobacteria bacterium]